MAVEDGEEAEKRAAEAGVTARVKHLQVCRFTIPMQDPLVFSICSRQGLGPVILKGCANILQGLLTDHSHFKVEVKAWPKQPAHLSLRTEQVYLLMLSGEASKCLQSEPVGGTSWILRQDTVRPAGVMVALISKALSSS